MLAGAARPGTTAHMAWEVTDEKVICRQGGGCVSWIFLPTCLLGAAFCLGGVTQALRLAGVLRGKASLAVALLAGGGGLLMLLFGALGFFGRSTVVVDPYRRTISTAARLLFFDWRRVRGFDDFDRVEVLTGRSKHSRFHFACLRGPRAELAFERTSEEDAHALAQQLARTTSLPLREPV